MISKRIIFEGRLQGIGFPYAVLQLALGFDVTGWVKNLADGSIELVIEGEDQEIEEFIEEITQESSLAHHIKNFTQESVPALKNTQGFTIIKGA